MKAFLISSVIFIVLFSGAKAQNIGDTIISNNTQNLKWKVLYFHITDRCNTCHSIEINLKEVLFANYQDEIDKGIIDVYILNCELPENKDLTEKYKAYGSTLVYTIFEDGKEKSTEDISSWAFQKVYEPEIFAKELKEKINSILK